MNNTIQLQGHTIDLIRRKINSLGGDCSVASLAYELKTDYPNIFQPNNWSGYKSCKQMIEAANKFFESYYKGNSRTDFWVKIRNAQSAAYAPAYSPATNREITPEYIAETLLTDDTCRQISLEHDIPRELHKPSRLRKYLLYYMLKLKSEGKLQANSQFLVCNTGLYDTNGLDPLFLFVRRNTDGTSRLGLYNRNDIGGRQIIRNLGNVMPEPASFPYERFDNSLKIIPERGHIINDHHERLPATIIDAIRRSPACGSARMSDEEIVARFTGFFERLILGAVDTLAQKLKNGTETPVRFWYRRTNKMCWLASLSLGFTDSPSVAIVLEPSSINGMPIYHAHTILELEDAYTNARLVGPVTAPWLTQQIP